MRQRVRAIVISLFLVLVMLAFSAGCAAEPSPVKEEPSPVKEEPSPVKEEIVKVGFNLALTGPSAMWGMAASHGLELWAEILNREGGLKVGGKTYKVQLVGYDMQMDPARVMENARKLVLEDKVVMIHNQSPVTPSLDFTEEHKILQFTPNAVDLRPHDNYLIDAGCSDPENLALTFMNVIELNPWVKSLALTGQDDDYGKNCSMWYAAIAEAMGIDLVYNKRFALDTTDFAPVMTAMLATKPDMLCFDGSYPGYSVLLWEQAYLQGFDGPIQGSSFEMPATLAKVGKEYMEERGYCSYAGWEDPELTPECNDVFAEALTRWSYDELGTTFGIWYGSGKIWEEGVKLANSVDPTAVRDAFFAAEQVPTPFGPGRWYGMEIYGTDHYLLPEWNPTTVVRDGRLVTVAKPKYTDWWDNYGEFIVKYFEEHEWLWYQRHPEWK